MRTLPSMTLGYREFPACRVTDQTTLSSSRCDLGVDMRSGRLVGVAAGAGGGNGRNRFRTAFQLRNGRR